MLGSLKGKIVESIKLEDGINKDIKRCAFDNKTNKVRGILQKNNKRGRENFRLERGWGQNLRKQKARILIYQIGERTSIHQTY